MPFLVRKVKGKKKKRTEIKNTVALIPNQITTAPGLARPIFTGQSAAKYHMKMVSLLPRE